MKYVALLFFLSSFNLFACDCAENDIEKAFKYYPVIFVGTVEKIIVEKTKDEGWFNNSKLKAVTLKIEHSYKGYIADKVLVKTEMHSPACGYPFEENVKYAVFAFPNEKGLEVSLCSPTIHVEKREDQYEKQRLYVAEFLTKKQNV